VIAASQKHRRAKKMRGDVFERRLSLATLKR
jgi:hypothetical protein